MDVHANAQVLHSHSLAQSHEDLLQTTATSQHGSRLLPFAAMMFGGAMRLVRRGNGKRTKTLVSPATETTTDVPTVDASTPMSCEENTVLYSSDSWQCLAASRSELNLERLVASSHAQVPQHHHHHHQQPAVPTAQLFAALYVLLAVACVVMLRLNMGVSSWSSA